MATSQDSAAAPVVASFTLGDSDSAEEEEEPFQDAAARAPSKGAAPEAAAGRAGDGDGAGSGPLQHSPPLAQQQRQAQSDAQQTQQQQPSQSCGKAEPAKTADLQGLLETFYRVYNPENLHQIRAILDKYAGREARIYEDELRMRYLGDKPDYWSLIRKVYTEENPSKLPEVQTLLLKYAGKEPGLYLQICQKYQVEPDKAVLTPASAAAGLQTASSGGSAAPLASAASPQPGAGAAAATAAPAPAPAAAFAPPTRLGLFSRLTAKRSTQPSVEALKEHLQEAIDRDATSQQEVGQLKAELIDRDASMQNFNEEIRSLVEQVERYQLIQESSAEGGGSQDLDSLGEDGAGLREEARQLREQRQTHETALRSTKEEITTLTAQAAQRQRASEAFHGQEVSQLEQQVKLLRQSSELQEEQAGSVAERAGAEAVVRLTEARRSLEDEQCERDTELRSATEEIRSLTAEAEQWRVLQREEAVHAEEALHAAEERHVELMDAQALLADTQRSCSALSSGALEERDEALRALEALRAENDAKELRIRGLAQEMRERERVAEDAAIDAKETEDCLEAAKEQIAELEARLQESCLPPAESSAVQSVAAMVASAVNAADWPKEEDAGASPLPAHPLHSDLPQGEEPDDLLEPSGGERLPITIPPPNDDDIL